MFALLVPPPVLYSSLVFCCKRVAYLRFKVVGFGLECILVGYLHVLAGYNGCVGIASFDPAIPHKVLIGKFAAIVPVHTSLAPIPLPPRDRGTSSSA